MGRPRDQFCWDNVDKLGKGKWKCKHCEQEFAGEATRIRDHLSCSGKNIGACEKVLPHIREEALKGGSKKKRGRVDSSASGESNVGISTVANIGDLSTKKVSEQELTTTDSVVKFFVSRNIPLDAVKDPLFTDLLRRAAQHGFPSCLLRDDSAVIQRSVSNLDYEVNESMLMVKESWKTTGCTFISYNLDEWIGNPSNSEKGRSVVYGFYCPKGFIFVQGPLVKSFEHLAGDFKNHVLNLSIDDVTHRIRHSGCIGCEFVHEFGCYYNVEKGEHHIWNCNQQQLQKAWMGICRESGWVQSLIQKSEKLYDFILDSTARSLFQGWTKVMVEKDADSTPWNAFRLLKSIMNLKDGIKALLTTPEYCNYVPTEIVEDDEFWSDGKDLLEALTPLLQINDLLDTLVPTSGYVQVAVDAARHNLKRHYQRDASKYQIIKTCLDDYDGNDVAIYLSPIYDWRSKKGRLDLAESIKAYLKNHTDEDEYGKLDAELKVYRYKNPFANLSFHESENDYHPVTLWKKYGSKFPVLQKYAIKLLSQPGSCMCNQVKKHILHCQGTDNFILRLNYQMMQEFAKLGDTIYEPLGSQFLKGLHGTHPLYPINQISQPKYLGQIPPWMNEFISKYIDVVADGNCGYRAIAESVGLGQDNWREVRRKLYNELSSQSQLYAPTFRPPRDVETISKALLYDGSEFAPPETWLEVEDMGLLVATTFKAKFVVMGSVVCCTYLPLYLLEWWQIYKLPEIVVCLGYNLHFSSLSLRDNAPLPPIPFKWKIDHQSSTQDFDRFLSDRCASYDKLERECISKHSRF